MTDEHGKNDKKTDPLQVLSEEMTGFGYSLDKTDEMVLKARERDLDLERRQRAKDLGILDDSKPNPNTTSEERP